MNDRQFSEIDRQFDAAVERLESKGAPMLGAYGTAPLAADHFLLKKSWDYFRSRVRTIEDQWRKILDAKDAQLKFTQAELVDVRGRVVDLEEQNRMLRSLDQNIKKARTEDFVGFARKAENLRAHAEAERDALLRKIDQLEMKLAQGKKHSELSAGAQRKREESLQQAIAALRKDLAVAAEREREIQKRFGDMLTEKDDRIQSLESKSDLLRVEVERRERLIVEFRESVRTGEADARAMTAFVAELQRALKDKDALVSQLNTKIENLSRDKDALREGWERERAEWRELWDRSREMWDRKP